MAATMIAQANKIACKISSLLHAAIWMTNLTVSRAMLDFISHSRNQMYITIIAVLFLGCHQWGKPGNKAKHRVLSQFGDNIANKN